MMDSLITIYGTKDWPLDQQQRLSATRRVTKFLELKISDLRPRQFTKELRRLQKTVDSFISSLENTLKMKNKEDQVEVEPTPVERPSGEGLSVESVDSFFSKAACLLDVAKPRERQKKGKT